MTGTHKKPCEKCGGEGLVARQVAPLSENDHVRRFLENMPFAGKETCDRCSGSGEQSYAPAGVAEPSCAEPTII